MLVIVVVSVAWSAEMLLPQARLSISVVDDLGSPVEGAKVTMYTDVSKKDKVSALTTAEGLATGTLRTSGSITFHAAKEGFYYSRGEFLFRADFDKRGVERFWGSHWESQNAKVELILKRKRQPIAMYAKWVEIIVPEANRDIAFDCQAADWLPPFGRGTTCDWVANGSGALGDGDYKVTLRFPRAGDGVRVFARPDNNVRSELRSPAVAPEDGYVSQIVIDSRCRILVDGRPSVGVPSCFVFRVRSVLDDDGNLLSAHYGKMYPSAAFRMAHYWNPNPNSRVLEYDIEKNMFARKFGGMIISEP